MNFIDQTKLLFKLGWRNIWRQKRRSVLVMSSAAAGILGVLLTMGFGNGFFGSMVEVMIGSGLGHVQIRPEGYDRTRKSGMLLPEPERLLGLLENSNLPSWAPRLEREGLLRAGSHSQGVQIIGIDPDREAGTSSFGSWVSEGAFDFQVDERDRASGIIGCILGKTTGEKMEVGTGDWAILSVAGKGGSYNSIRCRITGIFRAPAEPMEKFMVFADRKNLSHLFANSDNQLSYIVMMAPTMEQADELKNQGVQLTQGVPGIEILTYDQMEKGFKQMMDMMDSFSFVSYLVLLAGVALILFDSITMSIYERMREIGILRAIGSRPRMIFWMVIMESTILTLGGSIAGILLGWMITLYFQYTGLDLSAFSAGLESFGGMGSVIHPYIRWSDVYQGLIVALLVSIVSGIFPARKAIRMSPIKAIYNR